MHELALTEKILKLVLLEAEAHEGKKVKQIKIRVGELSGIVEESVELYFKLISKETIAADAELLFTRTEARLFCVNCNQEFVKDPRDFLCPVCGTLGRLTAIGQECVVESIEVS